MDEVTWEHGAVLVGWFFSRPPERAEGTGSGRAAFLMTNASVLGADQNRRQWPCWWCLAIERVTSAAVPLSHSGRCRRRELRTWPEYL